MPSTLTRALSSAAVVATVAVAPFLLASPAAAVGDAMDFTVEIHVGADWIPLTDGTRAVPRGETYDARIAVTNIAAAGTLSVIAAAVLPAGFTGVTCTNATALPGETLYCNGSFLVPDQIWGANATVTAQLDGNSVELTKGLSVLGYFLQLNALVRTESAPGVFRDAGDPELLKLPLGFVPQIEVAFSNSSNVLLPQLVYNPVGCAVPNGAWPDKLYPPGPNQFETGTCPFVGAVPASNTPTSRIFSLTGTPNQPNKSVSVEGVSTYSGDGGCTAASATTSFGEKQTVSCVGFLPGIEVEAVLNSAPVALGPVATGSGAFSFSFVVPASVGLGDHSVTLSRDGTALTTTPTFAVVPSLAATGVTPLPALAAGAAALLLGVFLFARSRKRVSRG